ncbi:MAG: outer membrane protein assembly factor BamA, partial [Cytophagales bacterium]
MNRILLLFLLLTTLASEAQIRRRARANATQESPTTGELNYRAPQEYTIAGIEVKGLKVLDKNAMVSLTGLKVGDKIKIPGDAIANAIRKLWKHGLVGDAAISVDRIEEGKVYLVIGLAERPRLTDFYFDGITKGKISGLKDDLTLIRGKIVNDATIRNAELAVKKHFVKKGFLNTSVKIVQERDTLNRGGVRLRINVDLKAKVKIHEIKFEGNDQISSTTLKKKLKKTKEHPRINIHREVLQTLISAVKKPANVKEFFHDSAAEKTTWRQAKEFINRTVKPNI